MNQSSSIRLTSDQVSDYQRNGYLILENLLSVGEIDAFLAHQAARPKDLDLGIRSHCVDPQWKYVATHPKVASVSAQLLDGVPKIVQSMFLAKKAGAAKPGVALHQDTHYLPTEPNTLMACWIAMSDTGPGNGGLCVVPGSHLQTLLSTHQSSSDEHDSWRMEHLMRDRAGKEWTQEFYSFAIDDLDPGTVLELEVPKGAGVFFSGMTIHGSYANRSATQDRLAFAVHYVHEDTWVLRADVQDTMVVSEILG